MMFSMMARLGTFVCNYVSDFALFSRLLLISELKCCNCVVLGFSCASAKSVFVYLF